MCARARVCVPWGRGFKAAPAPTRRPQSSVSFSTVRTLTRLVGCLRSLVGDRPTVSRSIGPICNFNIFYGCRLKHRHSILLSSYYFFFSIVHQLGNGRISTFVSRLLVATSVVLATAGETLFLSVSLTRHDCFRGRGNIVVVVFFFFSLSFFNTSSGADLTRLIRQRETSDGNYTLRKCCAYDV